MDASSSPHWVGAAGRARPRLLFLLPTLQVGGAERHAVDLVERLRRRGFPCRILVYGAQVSEVVAAMPGARDAAILGLKGLSEAGGWARVWRELRRAAPDVVVTVNQTLLIVGLLERLAGATRAPIACLFHSTKLQDYERYQEGPFWALSPLTDLLVYVGETQRRIWEGRGIRPRRAAVIRNGVDLDRFATADGAAVRARHGIDPSAFLLGIVAALRPEKNHVELVRGLRAAADRGVPVRVLAVGEGPTRAAVEALARELGVADRLCLAGEQADVAPFVAACDAGLLCSTAETFPLSAIEFLAAGRPMIAARVGGVPDIVEDGATGRLYASGDPDDLAAAMCELADPARRAPLAARARPSVEALSAERMADAYAEAFTALAAPRAGRR